MAGLLAEPAPRQSPMQQFISIFVPEILSRGKTPTRRLGTTAWLDGLRGWAAFSVAFSHMVVYTHEGIEMCYGHKLVYGEGYNTSPAVLPILRLPFTGGHFAVSLFFVISGYVVPRRLLSHLQEGRRADFLDDVQCAMVRRPVRLFLPVILSTLVVALSWHLLGIPSPSFEKKKSNVFAEILSWAKDILEFMYFYKWGALFTYYNPHTWTIAVEQRGSMLMFAYLVIVHTLSNRMRVLMTLAMIIHMACFSGGAWYACFFAGMNFVDLEMMAAAGKPISFIWDSWDRALRAKKALRTLILHALFTFCLYLATQPAREDATKVETLGECYGWGYLSLMIPSVYTDAYTQYRWFWLFWAAWIMTYVTREIGWLRGVFESKFAQYLGRHSFALYLVHGPLITTVSQPFFYMTGVKQSAWDPDLQERWGSIQNILVDAPWWPIPAGGPWGLEPNFLFVAFMSLIVFLYVAEIGTKLFDAPSVQASKWVWRKWKTF